MKHLYSNLWQLQRAKKVAVFRKLSEAWEEIRTGGNKMDAEQSVIVLQGNVQLNTKPNATYSWYGPVSMDRELKFREAYVIERNNWDKGIQGCIYQVKGREFTDLSFVKGKTLAEYPDDYEIREHMDGTKFIFSYSSIPTFDYTDRLWASTSYIAIYEIENEVVLLSCRHGAKIPRIEIYIGLEKSVPSFDRWLYVLKESASVAR